MRKWFFIGLFIGMAATALTGKKANEWMDKAEVQIALPASFESLLSIKTKKISTQFDIPMEIVHGKSFGVENSLTAELFRGGKILVDGKSGYAHQISDSYRDSAWIRSTKALPQRYKISVMVGEIDYGLEKIQGLEQDPEYPEGPQNENGVYLLAITDIEPRGHHDNIWWHQHRKVVVDVDNNVWGHGMPNPIFMVRFDRSNELNSLNGRKWTKDWVKGLTYDPRSWYRVEIEKTWSYYILSVYSQEGRLLSRTAAPLSKTFHTQPSYPDYFVIGEPHENYYAGNFKIKEIVLEY